MDRGTIAPLRSRSSPAPGFLAKSFAMMIRNVKLNLHGFVEDRCFCSVSFSVTMANNSMLVRLHEPSENSTCGRFFPWSPFP